jgi:predicted ATPase
LGVAESSASLDEAVGEFLREKRLLLVLDNLEQLLPDVELVARLLAAAPRLLVLATSRSPLRLAGEHAYPVPPLPLPAPARDASFEELAANEAVALFVARARAADHGFELNDENARAVADVCGRLDGLPLAIELAAARAKLLHPSSIGGRLDQALELLTGGARDLPARQRTLRSTLEWSYDLLGENDRTVFARLAVFSGGWTLAAAEAVCSLGGLPVLGAPGADAGEARIAADLQPPALIVHEMPVQDVQLVQRHPVDQLFDEITGGVDWGCRAQQPDRVCLSCDCRQDQR